ncbi:MAG: M23 family metallopeptidase [Pseudomonadota bacterium]|nr:M23 family metallopeptidase [Pseudomonadota bacterium]
MSRLKLVGSNLLTALVTAAVTSIFWLFAFNAGPVERASPAPQAEAPAQPEIFTGPNGLVIPVAGVRPEDLRDTYKQARAGGARVHDAIDIMAPEGRAVVAAAPGSVEKLFFSKGGGGVTVYVRSPDTRYVFYYAHLRDYAPGLKEGQVLKQGDPIGSVGVTGNANPAGPHLHFAVHRMAPGERWHQGMPINPYPLLVGSGEGG